MLSYSAHMKLGFEESQTAYTSGTQKARAWTEAWVGAQAYCPNCGQSNMTQFPNNSPLADFLCKACSEEFELKSQKKAFGAKVADGAYGTKCERLAASNNPNLLLMNYDRDTRSVINLFVVPKHFFIRDIIEQRKPLAATARRAGWSGRTFFSIAFPSRARFTSSGIASSARRRSCCRSGAGRSSSARNPWMHADG
nr:MULTISPECIES: DpnI domain-containing protein [unclassified Bradyrhizobium]